MFVADTYNHRVQVFDSAGNFIRKWGTGGRPDGRFRYPSGVAVDAFGNVFVTDYGNDRVQVFDSTGNFLEKWGREGPQNGRFDHPSDVEVDASGNVFVADEHNHRIQVFAPPRPSISIDSGPRTWTRETDPIFTFSSDDPQADFRCRISPDPTRSDCSSPTSFTGLTDGAYWFRVFAVSRFGVESEVIKWDWNVDTTAPDVSIDSGPSGTVTADSAVFTFSSTDATARFRCRLDGSAWGGCTSPESYSSLADDHIATRN